MFLEKKPSKFFTCVFCDKRCLSAHGLKRHKVKCASQFAGMYLLYFVKYYVLQVVVIDATIGQTSLLIIVRRLFIVILFFTPLCHFTQKEICSFSSLCKSGCFPERIVHGIKFGYQPYQFTVGVESILSQNHAFMSLLFF